MRISLLFLIAALTASCIDKDYDLSKVDTGGIAIGGEGSVFRMPLATITVGMDELTEGGVDIEALLREAYIWLPTTLPGGVNYVDIPKLNGDDAYVSTLLDGLIAQMKRDNAKLEAVTDLVWDKYRAPFLPMLPPQAAGDAEQFKELFMQYFATEPALQEEARRLAQQHFADISVEPLRYDIGPIDLSSEVIDLLTANLDSPDTPASEQKNTLHLYGEIASSLPVSLRLTPHLTPTSVQFPVDVDALKPLNPLAASDDTQLFADDLRQIVEGIVIDIPVDLRKYYPGIDFGTDRGKQIVITLRLIKHGGLSLNI